MEEPTDPSDWPFRPLADLDALMRCPICFDYFNIAVMLPNCSHNYCSLCIRRYLTVKQQCPTCSQAVSESQLQCNRLLDELVQSFKSNRREFTELITSKTLVTSQKIETVQASSDSHTQPHSSVKPSSRKERRKSSSKISTSVNERDKAKTSVQRTKKAEQSVAGVHVLDSSVSRVEPKDKNTNTSTSYRAAGDSNTHLVPEPPGESQLDFDEINSHELEEDIVITAGGSGVEVNKTDIHVETEGSSLLSSGRTQVAPVNADITPQSNLSFNVSNESISVAPMPVSSHLSTPSRTQSAHNTSNASTLSTPGARVDPNSSRESMAVTPASNNKVNCPVCDVPIIERFINSHLDRCLKSISSMPQSTSLSSSSAVGRSHQLPKLPKLILTIMKDKELRKKCKDYHLSSQGTRSMLINRINEFTLQYNAQRDSLNPKSMKEIAQDVERMEKGKQTAKKAPSTPQITRRKSSTTEIEESRKKYELANESHFSELISSIKSRVKPPEGESSVNLKESGGSLKQPSSPSSSRDESINDPSYSPVEENGEGGLDEDDEEEIFVPESPELLSKERYSTRQHQPTVHVVPESPSAIRVGSPRESLRRGKRKLSTQLGGDRREGAQNGLDTDVNDLDFLPVTPRGNRKKQRRC